MSVTYDAFVEVAGASTNTLTSGSFTITASANRAAAIQIGHDNTNALSFSGSCGGAAAAIVSGSDSGIVGAALFRRTLIMGAAAPASGSQTATVAWTNNISNPVMAALTAFGVNQSTPLNGGTFSTSGGTTTGAVTVTSPAGDLTTTIAYNGTATPPTSSQTRRWLEGFIGAGDTGPGTANPTHTWTSASTDWAVSGANFVAAGGGAAVTAQLPSLMLVGVQ